MNALVEVGFEAMCLARNDVAQCRDAIAPWMASSLARRPQGSNTHERSGALTRDTITCVCISICQRESPAHHPPTHGRVLQARVARFMLRQFTPCVRSAIYKFAVRRGKVSRVCPLCGWSRAGGAVPSCVPSCLCPVPG